MCWWISFNRHRRGDDGAMNASRNRDAWGQSPSIRSFLRNRRLGFQTVELLDAAPSRFEREDLPWEAAFLTGKARLSDRHSGGDRRSSLPDLYIGAHAVVKAYRLLARDFRRYSPSVKIIAADTHP
jgi:predicted nucleic acid-binding protein